MKHEVRSRTAAQILVDALKVHGVDTAFCVPGESYLAVLDALYDAKDAIKLIVARQDGGAGYMAEAYGKLTGKPGICFVTRGPGATNASIAVHTAFQDSTPMILFVGQVGTDFVEREAFQEIDYRRMFGQMAKWVASIDRADRVPEYLSHAFHCAMSGRKGPVVLALPEDVLVETAAVADTDPYREVQASPAASDIERLRELLAAAQRPIVIAGGSGWNERACADLRRFAEANALPVGCAFRFQDVFDNRHANYAGDVGIGINPKLAARIKEADLVLAIGPRLGEMTTGGYTLLAAPRPAQKLVHVHAGAEELGRVYQGDLLINAGMPQIDGRAGGHEARRRNRMARRDAGRECRLSRMDDTAREPRPRADVGHRRFSPPAPARGRDPRQRRGQLLGLVPPLLPARPLPHPARADLRRDGLRGAGRRGGEDRGARSRRDFDQRRRRLSDERPGDRHRDSVRRRGDLHRREQRHVRHDPDAPGARLPGPGVRDRRCATRISPLTRAHSARTAKRSRRPRSSRRPSSVRSPPASPR